MKYVFLLAFTLIASTAFSQVGVPDSVDVTFTKVDVEASYSGDWRHFLTTHLNASVPVKKGAKPGQYTVIVQFIVDRDGSISDIKAVTNHGYGMEEEVVRVIKKSRKWKPALQNGRKVKAYKKQPVIFVISEK